MSVSVLVLVLMLVSLVPYCSCSVLMFAIWPSPSRKRDL